MRTKSTNIERKYKLLAEASRSIRFKEIAEMGPTISGIKRIKLIPPFSRRYSSMVRAYNSRVHSDS